MVGKRQIRTVRLSETVSPFGPGAIVDILGESFMAVTGDKWPPSSVRQPISCDRLAAKLRVDELWAAPSTGNPEGPRTPGLEFVRFPAWLFCQECRRMVNWRRMMEKGKSPACPDCEGRLVPMRFVVACTDGSHAADVPWVDWAHRDSDTGCSAKDRLRFQPSRGSREGLSALEVTCDACKTRRSLGELRKDVFKKEGFTCRGAQPWQHEWGNCGKPLEVLQRGATSLHFGESVSAIDIPEVVGSAAELEERVKNHPYFTAIKHNPANNNLLDDMIAELTAQYGYKADALRGTVAALSGGEPNVLHAKGALVSEEYDAFMAAKAGTAPTENFVTRNVDLGEDGDSPVVAGLRALISGVVIVDRLREVRASYGFRRYRPEADLVPAVPKSEFQKGWLPAVEGYGEGVFIQFDGAHVDAWAQHPEIMRRIGTITAHRDESTLGERLHTASPQYVLLHSFAHALMHELAFRSGYTAPSLRERIYCEADGAYAAFIYTTSSDVEGTLGGLARQGEEPYLASAIVRALEQVAWCANDPVCSESEPQSIDGMNLSACHACMLAPETSCEGFNLLLDRTLLVGSPDLPGFFDNVTRLALESSIR